ncbi:hypothetical protein G6M89_03595 [Natronolimnobius sp. AArcel1]|uniref:hypothetical protein n=1 Tax=Natronolimnobius sp. AArcel1 TaxID=1679093 RepID=UPI0013EDEFF6|nr:hypothetical protein [Natronolimnobius sp. AArcel1]NGM68104.1 hypothetical protein [Natronolimnobius sp. AArcel1]
MTRLGRRHILGLVGVGVLAGCLDASGSNPDSNESATASDDEPAYPRSIDDDVDHPACLTYENADRTLCYGIDDLTDEPVILEPSERTVEEDGEIKFTLRNDGDERFATNFYGWRIDKHVDGEWHHVTPHMVNQPLMYVEPGDSHTWTVTIASDETDEEERLSLESGTESITLTSVGSGIYAFRARGWDEDARSEEILATAVTFELEGDSLELTPSTSIASVEWDEDEDGADILVAHSDRGEDDEYHRLGAYELEVVDDVSEEAQQLITEQVVRNDQLRDAIALASEHDVERVRLEEHTGTSPLFGSDSEGSYEYQGTYYTVRTRELEGD